MSHSSRIDDISGGTLFFSTVAVFAGLVMVSRLLGNLLIAGSTSGMDWLTGLIGAGIVYFAFTIPKQRIANAVAAFPEQEKSIVSRFFAISAFLFIMTLGLNMWAWNTNHKATYVYQGPSKYIQNTESRKKYQDEIKRLTVKSTSDDIVILRVIITALTFGASLMYFVLLVQPYEKNRNK